MANIQTIFANRNELTPKCIEAGTRGSFGMTKLRFEFSDEWDETEKKIVFYPKRGMPIEVPYLTGEIDIPPEVMKYDGDASYIVSGVLLADGEVDAKTISLPGYIKVEYTLDDKGGNSKKLTPDTFDLYVSQTKEYMDAVLQEAKDSGEFDGESVTVASVSESTEDSGRNIVTFSDGKTVTIRNGSRGSKGDKGDTGAQGIQGIRGEKGEPGAQGIQGEKGDTGAQGVQGIQGEKGDAGTSVTVASVTESSADGGSNVVTFSDGKTVTVKNGSRGSQGEQGVPGTSVSVTGVTESPDDGGVNVVTFSDGTSLNVKNGSAGPQGERGDNGVFWVEYGVTKFADILAAYKSGRACFLLHRSSGFICPMERYYTSGSYACIDFYGLEYRLETAFYRVSNADEWETSTTETLLTTGRVLTSTTLFDTTSDHFLPTAASVYKAIKEYSSGAEVDATLSVSGKAADAAETGARIAAKADKPLVVSVTLAEDNTAFTVDGYTAEEFEEMLSAVIGNASVSLVSVGDAILMADLRFTEVESEGFAIIQGMLYEPVGETGEMKAVPVMGNFESDGSGVMKGVLMHNQSDGGLNLKAFYVPVPGQKDDVFTRMQDQSGAAVTFERILAACQLGQNVTLWAMNDAFGEDNDIIGTVSGFFRSAMYADDVVKFHGYYWVDADSGNEEYAHGWKPATARIGADDTLVIEDAEWHDYAKTADVEAVRPMWVNITEYADDMMSGTTNCSSDEILAHVAAGGTAVFLFEAVLLPFKVALGESVMFQTVIEDSGILAALTAVVTGNTAVLTQTEYDPMQDAGVKEAILSHAVWYGATSTDAYTSEKIVATETGDFKLVRGARIGVKFLTDTVNCDSLNVDGTGRVYVRDMNDEGSNNGSGPGALWHNLGMVQWFTYDGTYFIMDYAVRATADNNIVGMVSVSHSVTSDSALSVASSKAVKTAYDKAVEALDAVTELDTAIANAIGSGVVE